MAKVSDEDRLRAAAKLLLGSLSQVRLNDGSVLTRGEAGKLVQEATETVLKKLGLATNLR